MFTGASPVPTRFDLETRDLKVPDRPLETSHRLFVIRVPFSTSQKRGPGRPGRDN